MHVSLRFEEAQGSPLVEAGRTVLGRNSSSFSEEDLPSNLIAFYMRINNWDRKHIENVCGCRVSKDCRNKIIKQSGGTKDPKNLNKTFKPNDHNAICPGECPNALKWPKELDTVVAAKRGDGWDNVKRYTVKPGITIFPFPTIIPKLNIE
jgi:hypothetical protein